MAKPSASDWHDGLHVLERGWLSSNNVLLHGEAGEGAVLVDSSHVVHAAQTVAMMHALLGPESLARIVNTHLHADHCGGNAALQQALCCDIHIPPGLFEAALAWDSGKLGFEGTGHHCARFRPDAIVAPGDVIEVGRRRWHAVAAPGHDPHSIVLFDDRRGVLISADALWGNGFGVVFPELDGESGFAEVASVLDRIAELDPRWVLPGHGPPFNDVAEALARARQRLAGFRTDPSRHLQHGARVLMKYHLMEVREAPWPALRQWLQDTPLMHSTWLRLGRPEGEQLAWGERVAKSLIDSGALVEHDGVLRDA